MTGRVWRAGDRGSLAVLLGLAVVVCPDDLVFRDVGADFVWSVWRFPD